MQQGGTTPFPDHYQQEAYQSHNGPDLGGSKRNHLHSSRIQRINILYVVVHSQLTKHQAYTLPYSGTDSKQHSFERKFYRYHPFTSFFRPPHNREGNSQ
ncbi:MAG: hypothetical protein LUD02_14125 [Tannerellaceae bacterium]|nr:hypothetical protein [Tannerellaceae bacterium]MCD8265140.1 hypothetical protein [Tannerellaceae bacterium]